MRLTFVGCAAALLAVFTAGFVWFASFPTTGAELFGSFPAVSVNRALKGDRLPLGRPAILPPEPQLPGRFEPSQAHEKIPLGCDAAFSPISSPHVANIFRRCMA